MKKLLICFLLICFSFAGVGCEKTTEVEAGFISEITSAGSENYGVRISYADDSRLEGKGVDVQVKFSKRGEIIVWREGEDKISYSIDDYDEWYSLTVILSQGDEKEKFERFDDVLSGVYFFNSENSQEITLRVVAGDIEENSSQTGEILIDSEPISKQFTLKIDKIN